MAPLGVSGNQKWLENPWKSPIDGNLNCKIIHKNCGFSSHAMRTRYCRSGTPGFTMERNRDRPSREMTWGITQHVPLIAVNPPSSPWPALDFFHKALLSIMSNMQTCGCSNQPETRRNCWKTWFSSRFLSGNNCPNHRLGLGNYVSRWTIGGPSARSTGT